MWWGGWGLGVDVGRGVGREVGSVSVVCVGN